MLESEWDGPTRYKSTKLPVDISLFQSRAVCCGLKGTLTDRMIKEARAKVCMDHTLPAAVFFFSPPLKLASLKGMKRCWSTCSMIVFVVKKTPQASDDMPERSPEQKQKKKILHF